MSERGELRGVLVTLRRRVDEHFAAALARTPEAFACRPGCDRCCQRISVFAVEAAPIREALADLGRRDPALRQRIRRQADDPSLADRCALLVDGQCSVYSARPLICRSHGLPVAVDGRVDVCPLNFQDPEERPPAASVLRLDAVNQPLAVLAELWRRDEGGASPTRIELAALAAADDPPEG